ncbi:MAG: tetratricopeptide repeat protein [Microbacter sp.]
MVRKLKTIVCVGLMFFASGFLSLSKAQTLDNAIALTHSEQFIAAEKAFQSLISQQPQDGNNYFHFGQFYIQRYLADTAAVSLKKSIGEASDQFNQGIKVDPTNPLNYVGLAEMALFQKDSVKAHRYFAQAEDLLPGKHKKIKMEKNQQADVYVKMADAYVLSLTKDTTAIFNYLRTAEKLDPKNYEIYLVKGDAYFYILNDGSNAIFNYNLASKYNPNSPSAQLRIGQLWVRSKNYSDALTTYLQVIKMDPTFAPAYKELGFLYASKGDNENAKTYFQKFLQLSSGNVEAQLQYINTLFSLNDYQEAAVQAAKVLQTDSSNVDLYRALAYSDYELGKIDQAKKELDDFFKKTNPDNIRTSDYAYYARTLAKLKQDSLAGVYFLKAYNSDTAQINYLTEAANIFNDGRCYKEAAKVYQKKIKLGVQTLADYFYLGYDYYADNNFHKSDSAFATLIQKVPTYIPAYLWRARALSMTDPDTKTGAALPAYQQLIAKTDSDATKYPQERAEAFSYMTFYYFLQYSQTKSKDAAMQAINYGEKVLAINPNDEKAKEIIDNVKRNLKAAERPANK